MAGAQLAEGQRKYPKCEGSYCDAAGKNCQTVSFTPGANDAAFKKALESRDAPDLAKKLNQAELGKLLVDMTPKQREDVIPSLKLGNNTVNSVFESVLAEEQRANAYTINELQEYLDACTREGGGICYDDNLVDKVAMEQQELQAKNKEIEEQMKTLAADQTKIEPTMTDAFGTPCTSDKADQSTC